MRTAVLHNFLIEATIMSSIAILLMMIIRKTLRRQLGNTAVCFGWLLVAVRLLLPVSFANPLIHSIRSPYAADSAIRPIAGQVLVRTKDMIKQAGDILWRAGNEAGSRMTDRLIDDIDFGNAGLNLMQIYLIGASLVLCWFIFSNLRFRRKLRTGHIEPVSGKLLQQYETVCRERGVKPVPVIFTDPLPSACLVGVIRPYIALPLTASPAEAIHVLTHEICHLKNRDHLWSLLRLLCCAVHWFNPLVWIAAAMSRTDTELRCDDRVVRPMDPEQRKAYANVLVLAASRRNAPGVSVLATGMTMTGKKLKTRVLTVLQEKKPVRWLTFMFCVLAAVCLICAFATSKLPEQIEGYDPWVPVYHHVTDDMKGSTALTDEAAAQQYACRLWQDVFNGGASTTEVSKVNNRYNVAGDDTASGTAWYMIISDSGIVVDCAALENTVQDAVMIDPSEFDAYEEEVDRAADYLRWAVEQLAPGISGKTTALTLESVIRNSDSLRINFTLMPRDEISDTVWITVKVLPDGTMSLVHFTAEGNG
ncbi:MAG: M56 family metallopeptidase [Clostridia bacterium]|nr:M56 family metallopeptidase [Clostridia bacterium]